MTLSDVDWSRTAWWGVGALLTAALTFVVYSFVGTFVFGVFIYYATRPIYNRIRRRIPQTSVAAAVAIFAMTLPALLLVGYALLIVANQVQELNIAANGYLAQLPFTESTLDALTDPSQIAALDWQRYITIETVSGTVNSLTQAAGTLAFIGTGAIHLFVMLAVAFYLLRDGARLGRYLVRFTDQAGIVDAYGLAVDRDLKSVFFGNILNAIVTGTIAVIVYSVLNVFAPVGGSIPAAALVGLLAGVASLVPIVGMKLVYVPVAVFMAARAVANGVTGGLAFVLVFALASLVVVDTIPDLVLRPYVSGRSLHVGAVMLAYTLGPLLFGWYGIFLMPILLVLVVHFVRIVLPELLAGEPLRPYAVDPTHLTAAGPPEESGSDAVAAAKANADTRGNVDSGPDSEGDSTHGEREATEEE
ncbi:AI-2E family transporter [Halobaculum gomorrense]|uniref:Predicted PurR-regulated permease PerM n=1 Tax=Halobaculum gomorrense TaxID=43928 RepID=A0A1M5MTT6_9EURY|nr:AI-2E family transporter [Halobaculum gomorrense]SHG80615.1 Predicted PurR-regulated permease PerM [Halobaculum gomorrense]